MKKIKPIFYCSLFCVLFLGISYASADYTLDENFGTDGVTTYDATSADFSAASVADENGNVYAAGWTFNGSARNIILLKYDSTGSLAAGFPKTYDSGYEASSGDGASGIALDSAGNVYITGGSENEGGGMDLILLKYDSSGNLAAGFPKFYDSGFETGIGDFGYGVEVDSSGNVYIVGGTENAVGGGDIVFLKYDSSGNIAEGFPKTYDSHNEAGAYGDWGIGIALDSDNVYIAGGIENEAGESEIALFKYDSSGNLVAGFPKTYDSGILPDGYDYDVGGAVAADSTGNIYVAGGVGNASGAQDIILLKYDSSGNLEDGFPVTYDSGNFTGDWGDWGTSVVVSSSGDVYIGGISENGESHPDSIILKYSSTGSLYDGYPLTYNDNGAVITQYINMDEYENIYAFGGIYDEDITTGDFFLLKYITEPGAPTANPA